MTLKMGFKLQMTSFCSQKLWFGHLALYYDYYVTPWINLSWMSSVESDSYRSESSGTENLSDIWIDEGEEKNKNWMKTWCVVCIWTKSTNSQCGEQHYTAWWYWVGRKGGRGNYWQNLKFGLVSQVQRSKLLFQCLTELNI